MIVLVADARTQWAEIDRRIAAFDGEFVRRLRCLSTKTPAPRCYRPDHALAPPLTFRGAYQFRGLLVRDAEGGTHVVPHCQPCSERSHKHVSGAMGALHFDQNARKGNFCASLVLKRHSIATGGDNHGAKPGRQVLRRLRGIRQRVHGR